MWILFLISIDVVLNDRATFYGNYLAMYNSSLPLEANCETQAGLSIRFNSHTCDQNYCIILHHNHPKILIKRYNLLDKWFSLNLGNISEQFQWYLGDVIQHCTFLPPCKQGMTESSCAIFEGAWPLKIQHCFHQWKTTYHLISLPFWIPETKIWLVLIH